MKKSLFPLTRLGLCAAVALALSSTSVVTVSAGAIALNDDSGMNKAMRLAITMPSSDGFDLRVMIEQKLADNAKKTSGLDLSADTPNDLMDVAQRLGVFIDDEGGKLALLEELTGLMPPARSANANMSNSIILGDDLAALDIGNSNKIATITPKATDLAFKGELLGTTVLSQPNIGLGANGDVINTANILKSDGGLAFTEPSGIDSTQRASAGSNSINTDSTAHLVAAGLNEIDLAQAAYHA